MYKYVYIVYNHHVDSINTITYLLMFIIKQNTYIVVLIFPMFSFQADRYTIDFFFNFISFTANTELFWEIMYLE